MALLLGVAFFVVPFLEMIVIVAIGPKIGWDTTVTLLVLFSAAGAWLVKREGVVSWRRVQAGLQAGRMPTTDVVDGFLVLVSGVLLLCPGFITSALGLLLILPPVRSMARGVAGEAIRNRVTRRVRVVGSRLNDDPAHRATPRPGDPGRAGADFGGFGGAPGFGGANSGFSQGSFFAQGTGAAAGAGHAGASAPRGGGPTGQHANGSPFGAAGDGGEPRRAYRRPDEAEPEHTWGARVRNGRIEDLDVIDVDGEEIVFGQGELGPSGF